MRVEQAVVIVPRRKPGDRDGKGVRQKKLLGLTLVQRAVLASAQAGIRSFLVVCPNEAERDGLAAALKADKRFWEPALRLEIVSLAELDRPGLADRMRGRFWLIPADIVFDPELLTRASQADADDGSALHLVDRGSGPGDGEEQGNRLGLSLCPAGVFPRLARILAAGSGQFSDPAMPEGLFAGLPAHPVDIDGWFALRVRSKAAYRKAERTLLAAVRKPTDGFFSRHFNRHISLFLTKYFLKAGVTPIQLSVVSFAIGLASVWFIGRGGYIHSVLGAFLFEFASIFDGCDGENARLTYRTSKIGGFLDIIGDALIFVLFFLSLPVGLYRSSQNPAWLYLGLLAFLSTAVFYFQVTRFMKKAQLGSNIIAIAKDIERSGGRPGLGGRIDAVAARIAFIYRRDFFSTVVFLIILAGGAGVLMWLLAVLMPVEAVYIFAYSRRRLGRVLEPAGTAIS
jgi:phosphatidylglycerophosphate synthase